MPRPRSLKLQEQTTITDTRPVLLVLAYPADGNPLFGPTSHAAHLVAKWMHLAGFTITPGRVATVFEPMAIGGQELISRSSRRARCRLARVALRELVPRLTGRTVVAVGLQTEAVLFPSPLRAPYGSERWLNLNASWLTKEKHDPALCLVYRIPYPAVANRRHRGSFVDGRPAGMVLGKALRLHSDV